MLKAMLVASAVLPMAGRPARMTRSERLQAAHHAVEVVEAGRDAGELAVALEGFGGHVDGAAQCVREALEAALVAALLGEFVEAALGLLDLLAWRLVDRRVVGDVDHVLADDDELPAHGKIVDRAAVILSVDDGRRLGREAGKVMRHGHAAEILVAQERLQRDRGRDLAGADQRARNLVDAAMHLLGEVLGLEEVRHAIEASLFTSIAPSSACSASMLCGAVRYCGSIAASLEARQRKRRRHSNHVP